MLTNSHTHPYTPADFAAELPAPLVVNEIDPIEDRDTGRIAATSIVNMLYGRPGQDAA